MAPLNTGDKFPEGVKFDWVPITTSDPTQCGRPQEYDSDKEFKGKKVILVSVPGAFTPTCQVNHLPPFIKNIETLKSKGVDIVAFIAYNDGWVMNAWGKINSVSGDEVLFLGDTKTRFSKNHAWTAGPERNGRYILVIEKDGTISYIAQEPNPGAVSVTGYDAVLSKL